MMRSMATCLRLRLRLWLALALWAAASATWAHKPSDSYLTLQAQGAAISGQWDIALRDLDYALGLDADAVRQPGREGRGHARRDEGDRRAA
jgi:hypothetical protein